jgi:N6-adenosine-specific RNA methylase IME4
MQKYRTIVADPPWHVKFGQDNNRVARLSTGSVKGTWSSPKMNYNTMSLQEIKDLPVGELAENDAHLYLWVINKYIEQSYSVVRAWGFEPVVMLSWCKTPRGLGLGGTFVQTTEHVLFARRGRNIAKCRIDSTWWNWKRPEDGTGPKHSRKPEAFQDVVEQVSPPAYLEMFARRFRLGWDSWGNQIGSHVEMPLRHLTPLALDGGDSAASEQFPTPEVLSTLQGDSTPAHRK